MPVAELVQLRAVLPYFCQRIMVDATQFNMVQHVAGNDCAIGTHGDFVARATAGGEAATIVKCRRVLCPCLFHPAPHAPIRQWAGACRDASIVFRCEAQQCRNCLLPFLYVQQHIIRVHAARAHVPCRVCAEILQAQLIQKKVSDVLQIMHVIPMNRDTHRHANAMALQGADAANRALKRAFSTAGVVYLRARTIHRHLDILAATCAGDESGDLIVNQCAIGQEGETHPVADDTLDEYGQVLPDKRLSARQGDVHHAE